MNFVLPLTLLFGLGLLALRMRLLPPDKRKRTPQQRLNYIRVLLGAALAWLLIGYNLQRLDYSLDGKKDYQPSMAEKIIRAIKD
jgi:hypothetical protein